MHPLTPTIAGRLPGLLAALWLLLLAAPLPAAPEARLAFDDGGRDGRWETLRLTIRVPASYPTVTITVQDARGGPVIARTLSATGERTILMPLPLAGSAELPLSAWPIRVATEAGSSTLETALVSVPRAPPPTTLPLRVGYVRREAAASLDTAALAELSRQPVLALPLTPDELLNDPPAALAACDAILLDDGTAQILAPERAAALIACGVRLITTGPTKPRALAEFWPERVHGGSRLWVTPREQVYLRPPTLLAPRVGQIPAPALRPGRSLVFMGLLLTPAALAALLLIRIFTVRPGVLLTVSAATLIALTAGAIWAMHGATDRPAAHASWTTRHAPGAVAFTDTALGRAALFPTTVDLVALEGPPPAPIAATAEAWLSYSGTRIELSSATAGGGRLQAALPARRVQLFATRSAKPAGELLAPPAPSSLATDPPAPAGAFLIEAGYVRRPGSPQRDPFDRWLATMPPASQLALRAWYELACQIPHLYLLAPLDPADPAHLTLTDYGPASPPSAPSSPSSTLPTVPAATTPVATTPAASVPTPDAPPRP